MEGPICRSLSNHYFLHYPGVFLLDPGSFKLVGSARLSKTISVPVGTMRLPVSAMEGRGLQGQDCETFYREID